MRIWRVNIIFLGLLLIFLAGPPTLAGEDKVVIKTENGIPVVYNPKNPAPPPCGPTSLTLQPDLTIGQETSDENYMFSQLRSIQVDNQENIYALDWKEIKIKVYDKNGKFVRSFGTKGKGPGEMEAPVRMEMTRDNNLVIDDMGNAKFIFFSLDGTFVKEMPTGKFQFLIRFKFDSKGNIYADTRTYDVDKTLSELKKFDPGFNPLATFASFEDKRPEPRNYSAFSPVFSPQMRKDDHLVWTIAETEKYEMTIMNSDGKIVKKIVRDYDPVKITSTIKEKLILLEFGEKGIPPDIKFEIPSHFPAFYYIAIDDEDRLFVHTYAFEEKEGDYWPYYDVFDTEGRYVARFCHPRRELILLGKKNKIYCMIQESEEGIPLIKRYSMVWK